MNENHVATKYKVWAVFMYIFAGLDALCAIFWLIVWIAGSNSKFMSYFMRGLGLISNVNVEAIWHGIMAGFTIGTLLIVLINIHCGRLLTRVVRRGKAPYIIYGIQNIIGSLFICTLIILICVNGSLAGLIYLLPLAADVITAIMLFMRGLGEESPIIQQNDDYIGQPNNNIYQNEPGIPGVNRIEPMMPQDIPTQPVAQPMPSFVNPKPAEPIFDNAPAKKVQKPMGRVKCTAGVALGQGYKLPEDKKIIVGKSPQRATLVINNQHISNVHCSIRYQASSNTYIIKDHSSNGTFANGVRLQKDVPMTFPAGTIISLADGTNQITLG